MSDLNPTFSDLSKERRSALCDAINAEFQVCQHFSRTRQSVVPHKLIERWEKISQETEKLLATLQDMEIEMAYEIDRVRNHPRATRSPTASEILEEMPQIAPLVMQTCRKKNAIFPSTQAKEEVSRIKESLCTLIAIAPSGVDTESKIKDRKRKHDHIRDLLLRGLAHIYERFFNARASARREGPWPVFLSRILSKLEGKEISPDTAYDAWLKAKDRMPLNS